MTNQRRAAVTNHGGTGEWAGNQIGNAVRSPTSSRSAGSGSCSTPGSSAISRPPISTRSGSASSARSHSWGSPGSHVSEVIKMTRTILRKLGGAVAFLRRKIEVWFVLVILMIMGILGWAGFRSVENTQDALCSFARSSADTKDRFADVIAVRAGIGQDDPAVIELHRLVAEERAALSPECPPTEESP